MKYGAHIAEIIRCARAVMTQHQRPRVRNARAAHDLRAEPRKHLLHECGRVGRTLERFNAHFTEQVERGLDARPQFGASRGQFVGQDAVRESQDAIGPALAMSLSMCDPLPQPTK